MRREQRDNGFNPVRTRRVLIYTFLIIMVLMYMSARQQRLDAEAVKRKAPTDGKVQDVKENEGSQVLEGASGLVLTEEEKWSLILTNETHPVPDHYEVNLKALPDSEEAVDERIYDPLMQMMNTAAQQGMPLTVCSGYRTKEKQEELFTLEMQGYMEQGDDEGTAYAKAKQSVSVPEAGEHRLGLAVDIYSEAHPALDEAFGETPEGLWLREHAPEYGFILRYDKGKESSTGIIYEPWHFRYVGVNAATYMKEQNLSMEELYVKESLYE